MTIKGSRIEIKELSDIRVLSDDGINTSEMDSVVGGHGYYGHHGYHGYNKYYDFIDKYVKDYIKDYFCKGKDKYGGGYVALPYGGGNDFLPS